MPLHLTSYMEVVKFCEAHDLVIADVAALPDNSYTFLSEAHGTTSWLDHICVSANIAEDVLDSNILYGGSTSGHFPIGLSLTLPTYLNTATPNTISNNVIKWEFGNEPKVR